MMNKPQPSTISSLQGEQTTRIRLGIKTPTGPATLNESTVKAFIQRYSHHVQASLDGVIDGSSLASAFWAPQHIKSSPWTGLHTGAGHAQLAADFDTLLGGYRKQGMKRIHLRDVDVTVLDANHAVAMVGWAVYREMGGRAEGDVEFETSYFVRQMDGEEMKIFGWVETKQRLATS